MLAVVGWVLDARPHQERRALSAITAAATRATRLVIVENQTNVAERTGALGYVEESRVSVS
jgi:hypothetical protein